MRWPVTPKILRPSIGTLYGRNNPVKLKDPTGLYFVLASEEDRRFFADAIARGTRNRTSRERFLFLANDSKHRFELGRGTLPENTSGSTLPNRATMRSATITIDTSYYPSSWRTPTSTIFHEFFHLIDIFWDNEHTAKGPGDVTDPAAGIFSVFVQIGWQAESNPDDPEHALTPEQVSGLLLAYLPPAKGTQLLRRYYIQPFNYADPFRGTGFCDASNTCH